MDIGQIIIGLMGISEDSTNAELVRLIVAAANIIIWVLIAFIVNRISKAVIYKVLRVEKKGARALTIAKLLNSVVKYVIWFVVIMVILSSLGVDLTPFIASAGVVGLAVGFGAQEIVKDFISGFFIIFDGEFEVGEVIEVDGFKGTVLTIGLRTTVIENWMGQRKIINNGAIEKIVNFSRNNSLAIVDFGVAYETDLLKLSDIMPAFLEQIKDKYEVITEMPSFLGVIELADSSINMRIIAKTETLKHFQVERDIRKDIVLYFREHDIEIPFPQVVVHNAQV
jgi:small conductance mechanosensitive channel